MSVILWYGIVSVWYQIWLYSGYRIKPERSRDDSTHFSHLRNDSVCSNRSASDDAPDICVFHLRSKCFYGPSCKNYHSKQGVPYQWQHKYDTGFWMDFDSQSQTNIEKAFCKPENINAYITTDQRYICFTLDPLTAFLIIRVIVFVSILWWLLLSNRVIF